MEENRQIGQEPAALEAEGDQAGGGYFVQY